MSTHHAAGHRRRGLAAGFIAIGMFLAPISPAVAAEDEADIPDPAFRACLSKALDGAPLTADNLGALTSVVCGSEHSTIHSIAGAQHLTSTKNLVLYDSLLRELAPINALPRLTAFQSGLHAEADPAPLGSLPQLWYLGLSPVAGTLDLGVVSELTQLSRLTLLTNDARLPSLGGSVTAERVTVSGPNLTSLDGLEGLDADLLQVLGADKLADLTALTGSRITELSMGNSRGTPKLAPLKDVAGLEVLNVQVSGNDQVTTIRHLTSLRSLDVSGSGLTDLTALQPPATLEELGVYSYDARKGYDLANLGPRGSLAQLKQFRTWYAGGITSLEAFRGTTSLMLLEVPGSSIRDLTPLSELPDGARLDLTRNRIHDFSPLTGWTGTLLAADQVVSLPDVAEDKPSPVALLDHRGRPLTPDPGNHSTYADGVLTHHGAGLRQNTFWSGATPAASPITLTVHQNVIAQKQDQTLRKTPTPTITHKGKLTVGTVLTAKPASWDSGVTLTYRWQRNKKNIPGATGRTYQVTAADVGHKLRVRVIGSKTGYSTVKKYSTQVRPAKARFTASTKPRITGTRAVGNKLTASVNWTPKATLKYQWYRNGKKVKGATKASYTLKASDRNDRFSVRVTASRPGYTTIAKNSAKTARIKPATRAPGR